MTGHTDNTDSSKPKTSALRKVLKGIGGIGIGAALRVGGIYALADQTDYFETEAITGPEQPEKNSGETRPDDTSSPGITLSGLPTSDHPLDCRPAITPWVAGPSNVNGFQDALVARIASSAKYTVGL